MAHRALQGEQSASWLAMSYGCCAPRRESIDRDDRALLRENAGEKEMQICYEQPQIIPPPQAEPIRNRPSTSHSVSRHVSQWVSNGREFANRASSRASSYTLSLPRKSLSKQRPSIGHPSDFRRYDGVDGIQSMLDDAAVPVRRRRSFRPLELSIYLPDNRLSPLPDFEDDSWEELQKPPQALVRDRQSLASESSFLIQRKPVPSISGRDSLLNAAWPPTFTYTNSPSPSTLPFLHEEPQQHVSSPTPIPTRPALQRANTQNSTASRSSSRLLSRLPSPSRTRSNTAASLPSLSRRGTTKSSTENDEDIDAAIRELNTIVEERRAASAAAEAYRCQNQSPAWINRIPPSPSHHVPAIAPSLRMRVRSETLVEIGSAFSVPLGKEKDVNKALPTTPEQRQIATKKLTLYPPTTTQYQHNLAPGPLTSNPVTPPTPSVPTPTTPIQRFGAWIKRSIPSTPTSAPVMKLATSLTGSKSGSREQIPPTPATTTSTTTPFYSCNPAPPSTSRPTTSRSHTSSRTATLTHTRQESNDTATVTLFSTTTTTPGDDADSIPSTPTLSFRSPSPGATEAGTSAGCSPPTPGTLSSEAFAPRTGKKRAPAPAPLVLGKEVDVEISVDDVEVEVDVASVRSSSGSGGKGAGTGRLQPPKSPHYGILPGMELPASAGVRGSRQWEGRASAVGIAF